MNNLLNVSPREHHKNHWTLFCSPQLLHISFPNRKSEGLKGVYQREMGGRGGGREGGREGEREREKERERERREEVGWGGGGGRKTIPISRILQCWPEVGSSVLMKVYWVFIDEVSYYLIVY